MHGYIEVICGSMFSGKTEELVRRLNRAKIARQKIQVFKPALDDRYSSDYVQSHDGFGIASSAVARADHVLSKVDNNTRVVGIDEIQFFDECIVEVCQKLAYRGVRVIAAGLDLDFRGQPFGPLPDLLAIAEFVTKLSAVCMVCGGRASRTQRLESKKTDQILVGAKNFYEARCRFCHEPDISQLEPKTAGLKTNLQPKSPKNQDNQDNQDNKDINDEPNIAQS